MTHQQEAIDKQKEELAQAKTARETMEKVLADIKTLFPDVVETLKATDILVREGFQVMVYTNDDPIVARELAKRGCVAVMPLAAPIGSGLGIRNPYNILTIIEEKTVPILVDAGVGTASDAAVAMELGCDGILMNTAIAEAEQPGAMAEAMKLAVQAGRTAYLAGRMPKRLIGACSWIAWSSAGSDPLT